MSGCASGLFLRRAKDAGWEVEGIEPCEPLARKAQECLGAEARIHPTTLQTTPLPAGCFDVVTLWDVLEHVANPIAFLRHAGSLLKSGGYLFANVPNLDSVQARVFGRKWPLLLPEHLNYFNTRSLQLCGTKADLHWTGSFQRPAMFSLSYILHRLEQHRIPGVSLSSGLIRALGIKDLMLPIPLGEICGVWRYA